MRYQCRICRGQYEEPDGPRFRCAGNHPPGDCCHYGEVLVLVEADEAWLVPVGPGGPMLERKWPEEVVSG